MRGHSGWDYPLGRHHHDMGHSSNRFRCGFRPDGPPGYKRFGPGFVRPGPPGFEHYGPLYGHEAHSGEESDGCCQDHWGFDSPGWRRCPPGQVEHRPHEPQGCTDFDGPRFERHSHAKRGHGSPCHRGRHHSRERSPCQREHSPGRRPPGWAGRPNRYQGPPHDSPRPCRRCHHSRERPSRPDAGPYGPNFGPHFGPFPHFGAHRTPFGPCNQRGPYNQCERKGQNCDEESGNENERRRRKNGRCCRKDKDENRDETVLVQRIVVEKDPRCYSI